MCGLCGLWVVSGGPDVELLDGRQRSIHTVVSGVVWCCGTSSKGNPIIDEHAVTPLPGEYVAHE
jgi:hypothetical protein